MTFDEFSESLTASAPPPGLSAALVALWWDARGDWTAGHDHLQNDATSDGAWVHAYLHRKEGDLPNAGYWYRRAGKPTGSGDLSAERDAIARALLTAL